MSIINEPLQIKPYTKKDLASIYQISPKSFSAWVKRFEAEVGPKVGKYYSINQVRTIIDKLGLPGTVGE